MDQNHYVPYLSFIFIILTLVWRRMLKKSSEKTAPNLPPGPPKLPLIGNLHQLIGKLPHYCLRDLAAKYGPVMQVQIGEIPTFVVSSPEAAKDVLKTHDLVFANRARIHAVKLLTYNHTDLVMSQYGDYWRQIRKICVTELFSQSRVRSFRRIREEEASNLIRDISSSNAGGGSAINLTKMLYSTALSIVSRATIGDKSRDHEEFNKLVPSLVELFGGLSLVDLFPSFKILHFIQALMISSKPKKLHQQADRIMDNIVMEHKANKKLIATDHQDLLHVLLGLQDHGGLEVPLTTDNIKAIILDMFLAGTDTAAITVEWAISEMLKNPRELEKAQAEVRHVFARKGRVDEAGLEELRYLKLVIKETLRLHPPAPLIPPRESRERCEINGYEIPAKSRVLINAWAIGRDPSYWTEAERFFPDRFLNSKIEYKGNNFEFIPFGGGRRMCAGISFGPAMVELKLASLLYHFDWKLLDGQNPETLDMSEVFGTVAKRRHELYLVPIPYTPPPPMHSE